MKKEPDLQVMYRSKRSDLGLSQNGRVHRSFTASLKRKRMINHGMELASRFWNCGTPQMGHPNTQYNYIYVLFEIYLNYVIYLPHEGMNCTGLKWSELKSEAGAGLPLEKCMQSDHRLVRCGSSVGVGGCCIARKASLKCEHLFWHEIQQEWHSNRTFSLWSRSWHNVWGLPNQLKPQITV